MLFLQIIRNPKDNYHFPMNHLSHFLSVLVTMLAFTCQIQAQDDYERLSKAEEWYSDYCEEAVLGFESNRQSPMKHPQKYCVFAHQHAGSLGYALAVATNDESEIVMFTPSGNHLQAQRISKAILPKEVYWNPISRLGHYLAHSKDITLKERPLPVRTPNKKANTFEVVVVDGEKIPDIKAYNQMMFKPHRNTVRLNKQHHTKEVDEQQDFVKKDQMEYEFKLTNPAVIAKMFRGYEDNEMCPWVVKSSFFNSHNLLQYSRWKEGEPVRKASKDVCRIISDYYGGRAIKGTQWLATIESGERSFYAVQFENVGTEALAAMVCVGEGEVTSVWEFVGKVEPDQEGASIWFVDDEGDFMSHAPEIHCITTTDKGMELYIRLHGGESLQYFVLREMGSVWMEILVDYWVYVWD